MNLFMYSDALEAIRFPASLPFRNERVGMTYRRADGMGLLSGSDRRVMAPSALTPVEALRFHTPRYLEALERASAGGVHPQAYAMGLGTPDCPVFPGMLDALLLASGGTTSAARALLRGEAQMVFTPAGGFHHAHAERASGFCYLADGVLAILELLAAGKRVLYLDIDAHHGDGVQEAFYDTDQVMTVSLHQSGRTLFPGTGFEEDLGCGVGRGYSVNFPLPVGTDDEAYLHVFREGALPLLHAFDPDMVVIEVGMDALVGDPLAHLNLTNNALAEVLELVRRLGRPILATGGGGYHLENTVRGWVLAWSVLCGDQAEHDALSLAMGGVMRQTDAWVGGLRDRPLPPHARREPLVDQAIDTLVQRVRQLLFPLHGLT